MRSGGREVQTPGGCRAPPQCLPQSRPLRPAPDAPRDALGLRSYPFIPLLFLLGYPLSAGPQPPPVPWEGGTRFPVRMYTHVLLQGSFPWLRTELQRAATSSRTVKTTPHLLVPKTVTEKRGAALTLDACPLLSLWKTSSCPPRPEQEALGVRFFPRPPRSSTPPVQLGSSHPQPWGISPGHRADHRPFL